MHGTAAMPDPAAHQWCERRSSVAFLIRKVSLQVGRFCFGVLAFLAETLYLARRFCGLCNCNVNTEFTDL